ncbi:oxygen-insensitive NADPH nitroreductase [Mammaliicoccus sciuri]|uniref:NADPH-dependent oxidoreductase n=2 Tax=Mammaliicoccus sciuri TaxID=1296 RepID=A0AAI8DII5_MAMSC|nr:oxygen-insensitive NADPH nitroreductase [Mammaliicoccus sciuri]OOV38781.1 NADPH-dependent oxidoreductase [Staphylococcus sp. MB371]ASE35081.1 oxygen-insensitive NADPH nitroreductase [Mammaliicoccus sciuri]MBO3079933.1 oxygen-insensitive NADPH nitroreductase [Mammaliicoccus sciuri]MCD8860367.1 oxygen-insensitive NADPH nitroreductase [Mammaliicoccus sciuri]MCY1025960.1 oxygen-insensitive NADPH nitroreductase [Mammaliicoccus sciuri]
MNTTIETILNHKSVRAFKQKHLTSEQVKQLVEAGQAASTASYQQNYSIIGITDNEIKKAIAKNAGNQPFIEDAGHLFIFCADLYRNKKMSEELNLDIEKTLEGIDATIVGAVDASLAAQNLVIAAESMNLGVCYIGGVRDGIIEISNLLEIPDYVYPVFGLAVGYPDQENEKKPRIPFEGIYHENKYDKSKIDIAKQFDKDTKDYYSKRLGKAVNRSWSKTAVTSLYNLPRTFIKDYLNNKGLAKK